jgi:LemA protein
MLIVLILVLGLGLALMLIYNGLVRARQMVAEGWSGVEVQLKRRSNLIPNLVETVKGYLTHEQSVLEDVTRLRSQCQAANDIPQKAKLESALGRSLSGLLAVAENYPDLKATTNFSQLQDQLADIEDQIQLARRYYNGAVRNLNIKVESFPANLVAGTFGFETAQFFEIESPEDRAVPKVQF